ncbi:type II secretion system protein [Orenia marismortui]|uniref:type II secretion system protein n=1 Tax=Orenia marismortui TaxID=46469 RepID=UPI000374BC6C|nr:prepilin-type N-terminal cleavage/methylation domain-containing protein [Orenia marismortui]
MRRLLKEDGFTLLELLVVIAVIGILAAIVMPQVTGVQDDAQLNSAKASLANIQTALEKYKVDNGEYPTESDVWNDTDAATAGIGVDGDDFVYETNNQDDYLVYYDDTFDADEDGTAGYLYIDSGSSKIQELDDTDDDSDNVQDNVPTL